MEIKLKTKEGLVEPIIEIVDGVMVVSPKEVKYKPKNGDIIYHSHAKDESYWCLYIVDEYRRLTIKPYVFIDKDGFYPEMSIVCLNNDDILRPATEKEKQKLFYKLAEEGWEFNFEKKELVKLKWKPKVGEDYYTPSWDGYVFEPYLYGWNEDEFDSKCHSMGRVFKTKEECQALCDKLNEAINSVKP